MLMPHIRTGLTLVPTGKAFDALHADFQRMLADGLLLDDTENISFHFQTEKTHQVPTTDCLRCGQS
jgi:hypothetical protein